MIERFPPIAIRPDDEDRNPAVQLFGRRFFADQTVPELLVELLLVASSPKRLGDDEAMLKERVWPDLATLRNWPRGQALEYAPLARLDLKLFAFLGASRLETRHESHRQHYRDIIERLQSPARLTLSHNVDVNEVLRTLENLFLGFQGVGGDRTWCAQSFVPISRALIAGESIWQATRAKAAAVTSWEDAIGYFAHTQRIFLARGGELLYLQICNALRQDPDAIRRWSEQSGVALSPDEMTPARLHAAMEKYIGRVLDGQCSRTVAGLADFIGYGGERVAPAESGGTDDALRYAPCGWCPAEGWPEGFLFTVELLRICQAAIDPVERLELMEVACAMQVLRSLCSQSARYADRTRSRSQGAGPLSFVWAISDPEGRHDVAKQVSRRCVSAVQLMIQQALRHDDIQAALAEQETANIARDRASRDPYKDADKRYGHKLFLAEAKRIGLIVPQRGRGARFVLNDRLLRFLVIALIRPGQRVTYEQFKRLLFAHYGMAVDDGKIGGACEWSGTPRLTTLGGDADAWLVEMLDASGVLRRLSDSCSIVENPFGPEEGER